MYPREENAIQEYHVISLVLLCPRIRCLIRFRVFSLRQLDNSSTGYSWLKPAFHIWTIFPHIHTSISINIMVSNYRNHHKCNYCVQRKTLRQLEEANKAYKRFSPTTPPWHIPPLVQADLSGTLSLPPLHGPFLSWSKRT